jgi:hypothetical protein
MEAGAGETTPLGQMRVSSQGTAAQQAQAVLHESVHSTLSPAMGSFARSVRANIAVHLYYTENLFSSHFLAYTEEALAETTAQLGTRELTGLTVREAVKTGLQFPLKASYGISATRLILETGGVGVGLYGGYKGVNYLNDRLLLENGELINGVDKNFLLKKIETSKKE